MSRIIQLTELKKNESYGRILCYPQYDEEELSKRLEEIRSLGVKAIEFRGEKTILNIPVLGKGCVGIVLLAHTKDGRAVLKIRRTDADRESMTHEAEMLRIANSVGVGPKLLGETRDVILMEFIDGLLISRWIEKMSNWDVKDVRKVLREILEKARRLDRVGLDHGELSQASKHIIIDRDGHAHIIDFETASVRRRVSNVTSICQYLFISGAIAEALTNKIGRTKKDQLINALRAYKKSQNEKNFEIILKICGLK